MKFMCFLSGEKNYRRRSILIVWYRGGVNIKQKLKQQNLYCVIRLIYLYYVVIKSSIVANFCELEQRRQLSPLLKDLKLETPVTIIPKGLYLSRLPKRTVNQGSSVLFVFG
jgi:hypothetical protein